jgi:ferredoxin
MRAKIDQDVCIGCELCVGMAADVFQMNDDGKAESYQAATSENENLVQDAIDSCPVSAIEWEE